MISFYDLTKLCLLILLSSCLMQERHTSVRVKFVIKLFIRYFSSRDYRKIKKCHPFVILGVHGHRHTHRRPLPPIKINII